MQLNSSLQCYNAEKLPQFIINNRFWAKCLLFINALNKLKTNYFTQILCKYAKGYIVQEDVP